MSSDLSSFFQAVSDRDLAEIQSDSATINLSERNVGEFERKIPAVLRVKKKESIREIVAESNRWKIPLTPFSRGSNWGYGSKLPTREGTVLLDLSALSRILKINEEQGIATIEPGVTQKQLAEELERRGSRYFLDVTGSGAETSVLGNALERGIAYGSLRVQQLAGMEVILGNGTLFRTGFGDSTNPILAGHYPFGLGPSLDGLFFQSNFGIVIEAEIQLALRPEGLFAVTVSVADEKLGEFIEKTTWLKRHGYFSGIPHLADQERTISTIAPLLMDQRGILFLEARAIVSRVIASDWTLTASVVGAPAITKEKIRRIKTELGGLGRIFVHSLLQTSWKDRLKSRLISVLASEEQQWVIKAAEHLRGFHLGRPSDAGVRFLLPEFGQHANRSVDQGTEGFLLCTPLAPLCGKSAEEFRALARERAQHHQVRIAMTQNLISDRVLEAVISVHFDRSSVTEKNRAHQCVLDLTELFQKRGFQPYRVNIDQMATQTVERAAFGTVVHSLKQVLDPNGIISPGRYS